MPDNLIAVDRQALLDVVRALDIGARMERVPNAMDVLREPFFQDEFTSGTARTDGSRNHYEQKEQAMRDALTPSTVANKLGHADIEDGDSDTLAIALASC